MLSLIFILVLVALAFLTGMWFGMAMSLPTNKSRKRGLLNKIDKLATVTRSLPTNPPKKTRQITNLEKQEILEALRQRRKAYALKLYRKWSGSSLKQATEVIEQFKEELI